MELEKNQQLDIKNFTYMSKTHSNKTISCLLAEDKS